MAATSSAVEQRKLVAVYNELDSSRPKSAQQELQKYLKRSPKSTNHPLVRALRCLIHQRLGEGVEAWREFVEMVEEEKEVIEKEKQKEMVSEMDDKKEDEQLLEKVTIKGKKKSKGGKQSSKATNIHPSEFQTSSESTAASVPNPKVDHPVPSATEPASDPKSTSPTSKPIGIDSLIGDVVFDDHVMHCLTFALKPMRKYEALRSLHANSWAQQPNNLEHGVEYFHYTLREGEYRQAWMVAEQLWKLSGDEKCLGWAAMCAYLQSTEQHRQPDYPPLTPSEITLARFSDAQKCLELLQGFSTGREIPHSAEVALMIANVLRMLLDEPDLAGLDEAVASGGKAKSREILARRKALEFLTPSVDRDFALWELDSASIANATEEEKAQKKAKWDKGRKAVKGMMSDLRFKWARWELVEEVARREMAVLIENKAKSDSMETDIEECWDWEKELERLEDVIVGAEDIPETNYKAYLCYLSALEVLLAQQIAHPSRHPRNYLSEAREVLWTLSDKYGTKERAAILALLELDKRLGKNDMSGQQDSEGKFSNRELCKLYWERFGGRGTVLDDMKEYWALEEMDALMAEEEKELTLDSYNRTLNLTKLSRYLSPPLDSEHELEAAKKLWKLYLDGAIFGKALPSTDVRPADDFGLIAVQALLSAAASSSTSINPNHLLLIAVLMLEKILRDSPSFAQARMIILKLYRKLGAESLIPAQVDLLKMRFFQADTVLHCVNERQSTMSGAANEKARVAIKAKQMETEQMYTESDHETTEAIVACFDNGNYTPIEGMLSFKKDLDFSLQRRLAGYETLKRVTIIHAGAVEQILDESERDQLVRQWSTKGLHQLRDIRDWELFPDYKSASAQTGCREHTAAGPLITTPTIGLLIQPWHDLLKLHMTRPFDPEIDADLDSSLVQRGDGSESLTGAERALIAYAKELLRMADAWKAGQVLDIDLKALAECIATAKDHNDHGSWQTFHAWTTLLEAFAMFEIAVGPLKPSKKAKKGPNVDVNQVHESIRATTKALQDVLKHAAAEAKAATAEDPDLKDGDLITTLKALGIEDKMLSTMAKGVETNIRDNRRIGYKELGAALRRKAET